MDLGRAWALSPRVAVRPEPFGALLYDFGTRKLSFLKNLTLVRIVDDLAAADSADDAIARCGVAESDSAIYRRALESLARSGMIVTRDTPSA
ncbi:mycofactocin biosynthesis chaperone MftB [Gordonia jinhuaensis]|uniref:Mycofactocin binding protein MftB n=1 Tax=Gordonia jinhuaensis TaxID=1517702 RepID=A0A916TDX4_9ACTN|nr:hypothetical protein GCM10011489_29900 [Gordonia jinhuaensis]